MAGEQTELAIRTAGRYQVFAGPGFAGNPTSLFATARLDAAPALLSHARRQSSIDNAYICPVGDSRYRLRFFSHSGEIRLCGHALLAAACHLGREGAPPVLLSQYHLHRVRRRDGGVEVSLPCHPYQVVQSPLLESLLARAGLRPVRLLRFPDGILAAVLEEAAALREFQREAFDWDAMTALEPGALILTAPAPCGAYALRYFAPWYGKPEDSATGSAQACLAAWWLATGGETEALQMSPAGTARLRVARADGEVWLGGAVQVAGAI